MMQAEVENLRDDVAQLQNNLHKLDKDVALLAQGQGGLVAALNALTAKVSVLTDTMLQGQGALKFVRLGWGAVGLVVGLLIAYYKT